MNNELSNSISLQGSEARCDAQCKKVLSQKIILAWILKHTTDEFSFFSIEEVMDCIEEEPEVGSVPVTFSGREEIDGLSNESNIQFHIPMQTDFEKEVGLMCNYNDYVEAKGIEKGLRQGKARSRLEIAQKLLEMGMKLERIAEVTSLPIKYIEEIKDKKTAVGWDIRNARGKA